MPLVYFIYSTPELYTDFCSCFKDNKLQKLANNGYSNSNWASEASPTLERVISLIYTIVTMKIAL